MQIKKQILLHIEPDSVCKRSLLSNYIVINLKLILKNHNKMVQLIRGYDYCVESPFSIRESNFWVENPIVDPKSRF